MVNWPNVLDVQPPSHAIIFSFFACEPDAISFVSGMDMLVTVQTCVAMVCVELIESLFFSPLDSVSFSCCPQVSFEADSYR